MSVRKIRLCSELCDKIKYDDGKEVVDIYSLDIEEQEDGEQKLTIVPIKNIKTHIE